MNDPTIITLLAIAVGTAIGVAVKALMYSREIKKNVDSQLDDTADTIRSLRKQLTTLQRDVENMNLQALETRIEKLERPQRIAAAVATPNVAAPTLTSTPSVQRRENGFFGAPKGDEMTALFNDEYDELRDECYFRVHYLNKEEASFEPIDLMRLKSLPSIKGIVRYEGCALKDARDFQLLAEGRVRKLNDYWVVTTPVELQMHK